MDMIGNLIEWFLTLLFGPEEGFCQHCGAWATPIFEVEEDYPDGRHIAFAACDPCLAAHITEMVDKWKN